MKQRLKATLFLLALLLPATAVAYDFEVDGIYYNINGNEASVTYKYKYSEESYSGDVTIPATVSYNGTTYSVTSIGEAAFYECSGLTSVTITNSITYIGDYAFCECSSLTSVTIPNSVTSIGEGAFADCSGLTCFEIPNSVTLIGECAFIGCSGLTSIEIPNSVTTIGEEAFVGCSGLTKVTCLATTPPYIASDTFYGVTNRATLYVPTSSLVDYQTANGWKEFHEILPISMLGDFEKDGLYYHVLSDSTVMVIRHPDEEHYYQGEVVIPDVVTHEGLNFEVVAIDAGAFDGCDEVTSVTVGNHVTDIGSEAFQGCTGLTSLTLGCSLSTIGAKAFNYCNALQTVTCQGSVPPVMANSNCFTSTAYRTATLKVPRQQVDAYAAADYWYKFEHLEGYGSAGKGDVNADGKVSIGDVTALIDLILSGGEYNPDGDFNNNGKHDIADVTTLIDYLLYGGL